MILIPLFLLLFFMTTSCMVVEDLLLEKDAQTQTSSMIEDETLLDFPIELITGDTTSLREYQNKTILLVFFSVHCGHCHNESSHLEAIYQDYKDQGFVIISAEVSGADATALQDFADEYGITFPLGADQEAKFARYMEVTGVPHNVLLDADGNVASVIRGFRDEETLRSSIETLLEN